MEKLDKLAEKHGWKGLSPKENFRNAMRMIGDALLAETLGLPPGDALCGAAVALSQLAATGRVVKITGSSLETIMYKTALGAQDLERGRSYSHNAYTALCMIAGYVDLDKEAARELKQYGKEEEDEPAGDA